MIDPYFLPQDVIAKKRDTKVLSKDDIDAFVRGITDGSVTDAQIAAMGMAIYFNGMEAEEGAALTLAMRDSGHVMRWTDYGFDEGAPIVDKHSTGGVGDKVSFMLASMVAACGGYVPMISGRGLGHSGGTMDKLEAIPDYNVLLEPGDFASVTKEIGCSIIGQTGNLAPADKRFYAVRDVTATVESIPLITASILSKKLAAGLNALVMDVKFGNGAFMDTPDKARTLGGNIVRVANTAGMKTSAILTDMNEVLGHSAGNAVEILEAIEFLKNPSTTDKRLKIVTIDLVAEMLRSSGIVDSFDDGLTKAEESLSSGAAAEKFAAMVLAHGGPSDLIENPAQYIKVAAQSRPVYAQTAGYISAIDTRKVGQTIVAMGGGRTDPSASIDHRVGLTDFANIGDEVSMDRPICIIHGNDEDQLDMAESSILSAVKVSENMVSIPPVTLDIIRE